jgi:predicted nuclease of predicted toxin-antitoxin system
MLFVFDENYSAKIAKGLEILESGNIRSPHPAEIRHITELLPVGAGDDEVTKAVGKNRGTIFTKDKDFKTIRLLHGLYKEYHVGVIFLQQPKKGLSYWDNVCMLVENWERIKEIIADESAPFIYEIGKKGVQRFQMK